MEISEIPKKMKIDRIKAKSSKLKNEEVVIGEQTLEENPSLADTDQEPPGYPESGDDDGNLDIDEDFAEGQKSDQYESDDSLESPVVEVKLIYEKINNLSK